MAKLILVVDDDKDIRDAVKAVLQDEGFMIETAKDGKDCLKKLKKLTPDLIILDILMPGLTTKEIIKGIKKRIPIIFLTVVRLAEVTKKDLLKGKVVDYIEKPFRNDDLLKRVRKATKITWT